MQKLIIIILLLSSCNKYSLLSSYRIKLPKHGSYETLQGFRDGCDSAHSSRGNSFTRMFFKYRQTPGLVENDKYAWSWFRAYIYCFHIVVQTNFSSIDSDITPQHGNFFWNRNGEKKGDPSIEFPWQQGVSLDMGARVQIPGQGDTTTADLFYNCNAIFRGC